MTEGTGKNEDYTHAISVPSGHLDSWIYKMYTHESKGFKGDFYLIRCTQKDVRTNEFFNGIIELIINYALKKDEIPNPIKTTDIPTLWRKAKERFVISDTSGEPGEIILFALLETERNAPQLINKMALKTDGQQHYHGLDGIHIKASGENILMYYGESKLHQSRSSGINSAIKQLEEFHNNPADEQFELNLVSNNIDVSKFGESVEVIMKYLSPYTKDKTKHSKTYAVFIGYDWDQLSPVNTSLIKDNLEKAIEKVFLQEINDIIAYCSDKCKESILRDCIEFFFIPFPSVKEFRDYFKEEIS